MTVWERWFNLSVTVCHFYKSWSLFDIISICVFLLGRSSLYFTSWPAVMKQLMGDVSLVLRSCSLYSLKTVAFTLHSSLCLTKNARSLTLARPLKPYVLCCVNCWAILLICELARVGWSCSGRCVCQRQTTAYWDYCSRVLMFYTVITVIRQYSRGLCVPTYWGFDSIRTYCSGLSCWWVVTTGTALAKCVSEDVQQWPVLPPGQTPRKRLHVKVAAGGAKGNGAVREREFLD